MNSISASIPVDIKNPGEVLACLGFIEAAEVLLGNVEGHFDWQKSQTIFVLSANGDKNPFETVLDFLATASVVEVIPIGYVKGGAPDGDDDGEKDAAPDQSEGEDSAGFLNIQEDASDWLGHVTALAFPSSEGDRRVLPFWLISESAVLTVSHWADGSSRKPFCLFAGQGTARGVLRKLLGSDATGLRALWGNRRAELLARPFAGCQPIKGGTFYFDARRSWTGIDAGFSPDEQGMAVYSSPVVELLAAIGLEHARPDEYETRKVRYAIWGHPLPPMMARAALAGADLKVPTRRFEFKLDLSGKNKVTTFAREETRR